MWSPRRPIQDTAIWLSHLVPLPLRASHLHRYEGWDRNGTMSQPMEGYVSVIFQVLAVFRFFSFAMGAGLVFTLNPSDQPPIRQALLLSIVGLYNMARILWRFSPGDYRALVSWLTLGSDVLLAVTLVLMTDGLDSAFLIYSLAPILTASLLMDARSAVVVAAISGLSVSSVYLARGLDIGSFSWILDGNYLAFSLLYVMVCLLIAYLPFLANLNWHRHVRSESVDAERRRLRREVHDNVAQTLAFLSLKVKRAEERASSSKDPLAAHDVVDIRSMVERAYLAVRDYLDETPDQEIGESLKTRLAITAGQWSRDTKLPMQMNLAETEDRLSSKAKLQLLQIAREALANVAKHANPSQVWVELEHGPGGVTLRIRDDGRGFSSSQPRGHGRNIINERAAVLGATLAINSAPGEGTEVVVSCPYSRVEGGDT